MVRPTRRSRRVLFCWLPVQASSLSSAALRSDAPDRRIHYQSFLG